eukprot:g54345.t1
MRALRKRLHSPISGIAPSPSVTTLTRFSPFQCHGTVFQSSSSSVVIFLAGFGTDDGNVDVPDLAAVISIAGFRTNDGNVVVPDLAGGRVAEDEEDEDVGGEVDRVGGLTHSTVRHSLGDKRNELVGGKDEQSYVESERQGPPEILDLT